MTEPTQAQIEAAERALEMCSVAYMTSREIAKAALTAAAEVAIKNNDWATMPRSELVMEVMAAERERCARVVIDAINAKADGGQYVHGPTIVAAIRAMKP